MLPTIIGEPDTECWAALPRPPLLSTERGVATNGETGRPPATAAAAAAATLAPAWDVVACVSVVATPAPATEGCGARPGSTTVEEPTSRRTNRIEAPSMRTSSSRQGRPSREARSGRRTRHGCLGSTRKRTPFMPGTERASCCALAGSSHA